ncbi:tetratricopeptide repeat protein [Longispora urticae]
MSPTEAQLRDMIGDAWSLPYGTGQIAAVEEIIRHADAQGLKEIQYAARILATGAYVYGGERVKSFVPFAWCLAAHDRGEGDDGLTHQLLWHMKDMVSGLTQFPEVELERTRAVLADMERRYREANTSLHPVHHYRWVLAHHLGDDAAAAEHFRQWQATPRGEFSDCAGCDPTATMTHFNHIGRYEESVALATPVLAGTLSCREQPQQILTGLLEPYVRTGRLEEARDAHRRAYRAIQFNRSDLDSVGDHLVFCARTGNEARGLEILERHLGWLDAPDTPAADMWFCASAGLLLRRLDEAGHGATPVGRAEKTVAELRVELTDRALALAARFDARNGTPAQGDRVRARLAAEPLVEHLPLSAVTPAPAVVRPAAPVEVDPGLSPEELVERAEDTYDLARAAQLWARFDEVCPEPEGALRARRVNARGAELIDADPEAGTAAWQEAAELFAAAGDEVRHRSVLGRLALHRARSGDAAGQILELSGGAEYITRHGTGEQAANAQSRLGLALLFAGQPGEASAAFALAHELAAPLGKDELTAVIALYWSQTEANLGTEEGLRSGIEHAGRAIALTTSPEPLAGARLMRGNMLLHLGDPEGAVADFRAVMAGLPGTTMAGAAGMELASCYLNAGRPDEAALAAEDAEPLLARAGDVDGAERARYILSKAYALIGQVDQALAILEELIDSCLASGNLAGEAQLREESGEHLDTVDRDAAAAESFAGAAAAYQKMGADLDELRARRRAALSWQWAGEPDKAIEGLTEADAVAAKVPADEPPQIFERAMLGFDAARILANNDRPADALDRVTPVAEALAGIGAVYEAVTADTMRGRLLIRVGRPAEAVPVLEQVLGVLPEEAPQREHVRELLAEARG